ncbi:MAG: DUF5668 domain-containing protein, partial [Spirosomaceae bacterium]|nr:DUF5668 domain-containing protein [Spirosomataceae bacterium]
MKQSSNGLFWGVVLLAFGLVLLAKTLGWFHIDWGMTLRLWPLLLVAAGVSLLLRQSWSSVLTAILIAIAIPAAIINGTNKKWKHLKEEGIEFNLDEDWDDDDDNNNDEYEDRAKSYSKDGETRFMEGFTPETKEATLKFGAGAGKFTIEGTTDQLIDAEANTEFGSYILTNKRNEADKSHDLRLEME